MKNNLIRPLAIVSSLACATVIGLAAISSTSKLTSFKNILPYISRSIDMSDLSVTFSRATGTHVVRNNDYYYTSGTGTAGNIFYIRNASYQALGTSHVAKMCGTFDKGSVEPLITFTTNNSGTNLFEFKNIKSISAISDTSNSRTLTVEKSQDGSSWSSAGSLTITSSGGSNTDVAGAKYIRLTYSGSYTVNIVSFTINYSCSDEPAPEKTLSSISVSGQTDSFTVGGTFSFGGTVTAHYSDSTTSDVTSSATFSGYDMSSAGDQTVTVSYSENETIKTTTYSITVSSSGVVMSGSYVNDYVYGALTINFDTLTYSYGSYTTKFTYYCDGTNITFYYATGGSGESDNSRARLFNSFTVGTSNSGTISGKNITIKTYNSVGTGTSRTFSK